VIFIKHLLNKYTRSNYNTNIFNYNILILISCNVFLWSLIFILHKVTNSISLFLYYYYYFLHDLNQILHVVPNNLYIYIIMHINLAILIMSKKVVGHFVRSSRKNENRGQLVLFQVIIIIHTICSLHFYRYKL